MQTTPTLAVALVGFLAFVPVGVRAAGPVILGSVQVESLAASLAALVESPDPMDHERAIASVRAGVPPGALATFLEAVRRNPGPEYAGVAAELLAYRRVEVRGRAVVALAALGGESARQAVIAGLDDADPRIRRLALALAEIHGDPVVEELRLRVLAGQLAEESSVHTGEVVVVEAEAVDEPVVEVGA